LTALALYAEAAVLTDSSGPASILYELIEPWADQVIWNGTIGYGHARMWLSLLAACMGDHEQADQHLAFACNFQETNGLLLWAAHAIWAGRRRSPDEARLLEHARMPPARSSSRASTASARSRRGLPLSSRRSRPPRCDRAARRCAVARLMLTWHCERAANRV
jgi:hypothetical protein